MFIDQYTPLIVGLIRRAGLTDRDEIMDVYVNVCEQLSARNCERLKSQDAGRGSIGGWLAVVTRNAVIDWIRSRKGRRRLAESVKSLPEYDQRVFELHYWEGYSPSEITELLPQPEGVRPAFIAVLESLERIQARLTERHRAELMTAHMRSQPALPIDETGAEDRIVDERAAPDVAIRIRHLNKSVQLALKRVPAEDAAIVCMHYFGGLSIADVAHALGLPSITQGRMKGILEKLRVALTECGVTAGDVALGDRLSLDRSVP